MAALASSGCASRPKRTVSTQAVFAILPFSNQSVNVEAPERVRGALFQEMKKQGYRLIELETMEKPLKNIGISEGGQLSAVHLEALRQQIPADIFCYGDIKDFVFKSAVAVSQRKVTLALKLVEASSGKIIFEGEETGVTTKGGVDGAGDLAMTVAGKILKPFKGGDVADVELKSETREAIQKLLKRFPNMNPQ